MLDKSNLKAVVFASVWLLASISSVSLADWMPGDGHKMHFPQLPDEDGWAVYATEGSSIYGYQEICLAKDWMCSETGPVTDIHFWGAWKGGIEGNILDFVIAIAADIPASQNPDGYNKPGTTLWERTFEFWDFDPIDPPSMEGWYSSYWEEVIDNDHQAYFQYNIVDIPNPFYPETDTIYWLSISAIVEYDPTGIQPLWEWKSTENHWNDDACWGYLLINGEPAPIGTRVHALGENVIHPASGNPLYTYVEGQCGCPDPFDPKLIVQGHDGDVDLSDPAQILAHYGMTSGASYEDGDTCATAIIVEALPFSNTGNTCSFADDCAPRSCTRDEGGLLEAGL